MIADATEFRDNADLALQRIEWQSVVFAHQPSRLDLRRMHAPWPLRPVRIRVHRNQPFEFVGTVLGAFLGYAGYAPTVEYGPYDDALTGTSSADSTAADVEIVWLDFARYADGAAPAAVADWLRGRLADLRTRTAAPIIVANAVPSLMTAGAVAAADVNEALTGAVTDLAGVYLVDQAGVAADLGGAYFDERSTAFAGSNLSDRAAIETARRFGLSWIPGVLGPKLKAMVVDLDGTVYDGVLGEDGPRALRLTGEREALQRRLVDLSVDGLFLAVVSRNDQVDVDHLFDVRTDFPLRADRLSACVASWQPKAASILEIANRLRIAPDAMLFLDDNPGELASVATALPGVSVLSAAEPGNARRGLEWHPGLASMRHAREDALRAADVAAGEVRKAIEAQSIDRDEYLRSLGIRLKFRMDPVDQTARIHELSLKTNQFNTGFMRLSESAVADLMADPDAFVVSAELRDRLSDSGVVGIVVGRRDRGRLRVDEVAISCRALGRGIEDAVVLESVRVAAGDPGLSHVDFAFTPGPRNEPARSWLSALVGGAGVTGVATVPWERVTGRLARFAGLIEIGWE